VASTGERATADIVAALWPDRCKALVAVSGYLIGNQEAGRIPLPPKAELQWWYQFYFATERGRAGYEKYRDDFAKAHLASSPRRSGTSTMRRFCAQRDVPRQSGSRQHRDPQLSLRLGLAEGESAYANLEKRLARDSGHHGAHHHPGGDATVRHIPIPAPTPASSRVRTRTGSFAAASGTTCRKRRRRRSPTPFSKWPANDRRT